MTICIYCRRTSRRRFPAEHVIPQSFGRFQGNLTLHSVCGDCNQYFANHLELLFGRETGEGLVWYQYGISRTLVPGSRFTARVKASGLNFGAKILLGRDANTGHMEILYLPQVAFAGEDSEEWEWYLPDDGDMVVQEGLLLQR